MKKEGISQKFGIEEGDDEVIFPIVYKTGEGIVLIPAEGFSVISTTGNTILLKKNPEYVAPYIGKAK